MPPQSSIRPTVDRWNRAELEDHYYRLYDEHEVLKRQYNTQQEKMKKMGAKVLATMSGKSKKDIEDEDADIKIVDLERQVLFLQNKLQTAVHQLSVYAHSPLPSGPGHRSTAASTARSLRRVDHRVSPDRRSVSSQQVPRHTDREHKIVQVVSSSAVDHRRFDSTVMELRRQTDAYEAEIASLRDKLDAREGEMDEERARLKSQLTSDQRAAIQENIEVIRLQRQVKEKSTEVAQVQAKFGALEKDLRTLKRQHDTLLTEYDQTNTRLRTEQNRNVQLSSEVQSSMSHSGGAMFQITQELDNLKHENTVLKETNEKLIANAFGSSKDAQWIQNDRAMRARVTELENAVKADVNTRNEIFEKLGQEIASRDQAEQQFRKVEVQMLQLKAENERLERKMNSLSDGMTWLDVEQAIALYKQQKDTSTMISSANARPDFLLSLEKETGTARDELDRLRLMLAESVEELEKTRNMLIVQHRINADFQAEVTTLNQRTDTYKREYETKLKEYAQLLDQRTARIQRLENQLRDIAYGRRPVKIVPEDMDELDTETQLEAGQSLLEIKLTKLTLTELGLKWMVASQPTVFLTIEFFDFEIQFTPMIQGPEVDLDFTAEYTVVVSDLFIYYLQTDSTSIELHQAIGTNYKTWAAGAVFMRELLSAAHGRLFGRVTLVGTAAEAVGGDFGQLEYSIHLKVPLERALNLYKERALALGYVAQDGPVERRPEAEQTNQLLVIVHRCIGLKSIQPGVAAPSPYVMYQVFDFPHHSTAVHQANINPEFGDQHVWTLPIGPELDQYLRAKSLRLVVFDDAAANDELSYLGHVEIPLLPLSHNKPITGTFSLKLRNNEEKSVGTIDVSISWKFVYVPPKESLFVTQPLLDLEPEKLIEIPQDSNEENIAKPTRRIAERKPILPVPKGTSPWIQDESEVTGTVTVVEVHDRQVPERERDSSSSSNKSPKTSPPSQAPFPANDDELEAFKSKSRIQRDDSFPATKSEPEIKGAKPPLLREESFTIKKAGSEESEDEPQRDVKSLPSILGKLPAMPSLTNQRSLGVAEQKDNLPALPVAPPRKPRVVEFSEPLHESIPPSESQSRGSNEDDEPSTSKHDTNDPTDGDEEDDGARVAMRVQSLQLVEDSPLLDREYDGTKAFIEWKFLDLPQEECETPASLPLPRKLGQSIDYDCYRNVPLNDRRIALLKQWATLDTKMEFTLVSDPGDAGDCDDLGVAQLSLQSVLHDNQQTLTFYNVDGFPIAEVDIDVHYSDSLVRAFEQA